MGRGRAPCCAKVGLKKGPWTPAEDIRLISYIQKFGHGNWRALPKQAGLLRCGKSCRLRWINYLRPDIKRGNFTPEEEETIIKLHALLGNKWSKIASQLPGRTDNEIKNVWNTHIKKRLVPKETSPSRSEPKQSSGASSSSDSCVSNCNQDEGLGREEKPRPTIESGSSSEMFSTKEMLKNAEPLDEIIEIPIEPNSDFWDILNEDSSNMSDCHESKATPRYEIKDSSSSSSSSSYPSTSNQVHEGPEEQAHPSFKFQRLPEVETILYKENNNDHSQETDEISLDPNVDFWKMDYDLNFFASSVEPVEEQVSHQNQSLGEGLKAEVEPTRWITYLENELELWEPIDQHQQSLVKGYSSEQGFSFSPYDGTPDVEFDPVGAYFQMRPSPTIFTS